MISAAFPYKKQRRRVLDREMARSRHSLSLAIETFVSRATSSSGSPRNSSVPHPRATL
jgi:hypothetical protein